MAAYAALVSVMQTIDQIQNNPHSPISLHKNQSQSLTANLTFLQHFLEGYTPHLTYSAAADPLQSRIAEAAYAAEDAIDSYVVDRILARSTNQAGEISSPQFYQGMERVLEEMDLVKTEVKAKVKEMEENTSVQIKKLIVGAGSFRSSSSSPAQKVTTVGLEEVVYEMLDKVAGGGLRRQIIPIVGMGRLGKTTLARSIYENPLIKERFDVCAWSTISQVHNTRKLLGEILAQVDKEKEKMGDLSEYELGEKLYKYLIGRRYLIVMDDR